MKLLSSHFAAPAFVAVLSIVAGCSSDTSSPNNTAGSSPGGAASGGKAGAGAAGSSGGSVSAGGAGAGGSAGSVSAAGAGTAGAAGLAGGVGTAGSGGGAAVEASFATVKNIIQTQCFGSGCHSEMGNPLQMEIDDKLYGTLTTYTTQHCGKLVNTASPADSAIVKVLIGPCNETPRMPFQKCFEGDSPADNESCVSTANMDAIKAWIAKGAPQ